MILASLRISFKRGISTGSKLLQQEKAIISGIKSLCPAGTPLNLQIKKSGKEITALEDSEYPEWLWTVLDQKAQEKKLSEDPLKLRKKQMRKANRKHIKQNNFLSEI